MQTPASNLDDTSVGSERVDASLDISQDESRVEPAESRSCLNASMTRGHVVECDAVHYEAHDFSKPRTGRYFGMMVETRQSRAFG
jgi:hypothetical protein